MIHFILAVILFFLQNWLGSKSYSKGYIRFSLLDENDEAHALNFAIKVFGPSVYLILCVAVFQYFQFEEYNYEILRVIYYYIGIRLLVIILYERIRIVNWWRISIYYASIILISTIIYNNFIEKVDLLLPDLSEIKNELWLLIIIFIYQIGNGFVEKTPTNMVPEISIPFLAEVKRRKRKYILRKYSELKSKYEKIIENYSSNDQSFTVIILSILIFENFNRPRFIRFLERIWVRISKVKTTQGIMQVGHNKPLSDKESVELGVKYLFEKYAKYKKAEYTNYLFRKTIKRHCPDKKYIRQILFIAKCIIDSSSIKNLYSPLLAEIISEFELYDYYDEE